MKKVRIKLVDEGCHFGSIGIIIALNGKKIGEGRLCSYQFYAAAYESAKNEAESRGYIVIGACA